MVERYICVKIVFMIWLHTAHLNQILPTTQEGQFSYFKIPTTQTRQTHFS
jgi:hypothetical protein